MKYSEIIANFQWETNHNFTTYLYIANENPVLDSYKLRIFWKFIPFLVFIFVLHKFAPQKMFIFSLTLFCIRKKNTQNFSFYLILRLKFIKKFRRITLLAKSSACKLFLNEKNVCILCTNFWENFIVKCILLPYYY